MLTIYYDWWKDNEVECVQFLDNLSKEAFDDILVEGSTIGEIADSLEAKYNFMYQKEYNTHLMLFDCLTEDELEEYILERFGLKFREIIVKTLERKELE